MVIRRKGRVFGLATLEQEYSRGLRDCQMQERQGEGGCRQSLNLYLAKHAPKCDIVELACFTKFH